MQRLERERRLGAIKTLLFSREIETQDEIVAALADQGFEVTQSSISRDLHDLRVAKSGGHYKMAESLYRLASVASVCPAGPNLIVLRTLIGAAQRVAYELDDLGIDEIIGTVAGDDTLFIAVSDASAQTKVLAQLEFKNG